MPAMSCVYCQQCHVYTVSNVMCRPILSAMSCVYSSNVMCILSAMSCVYYQQCHVYTISNVMCILPAMSCVYYQQCHVYTTRIASKHKVSFAYEMMILTCTQVRNKRAKTTAPPRSHSPYLRLFLLHVCYLALGLICARIFQLLI